MMVNMRSNVLSYIYVTVYILARGLDRKLPNIPILTHKVGQKSAYMVGSLYPLFTSVYNPLC